MHVYKSRIYLSAMAHHRRKWVFVLLSGMHFSNHYVKIASGKWPQIIRLWRHQVNFDSQTITMIGLTVLRNQMLIVSSPKHF